MARYALVNDTSSTVENVIVWDGESDWAPAHGYSAVQSDTAQIGDEYANGAFTSTIQAMPPSPSLDDVKRDLIASIDGIVATTYSTWTRFQAEYEARQAAAQAFKDAGYVGDPGIWISSYASAAGLSNQQATDNILAQAEALSAVLASIGAQRMRKYAVLSAPDAATAQSIHDDIIAQINADAAALQ